MVLKAKEYIRKGDIIQAVLSQRLSARIKSEPFNIYRRLRGLNPSAYMFYLKFNQRYLIGSSPEMLARCENKIAATRPIAGTRPRGINENQDNKLEKELLNDQKEKAEHLMLVDLGRNDLGRVCKFGSVKVTEFMRVGTLFPCNAYCQRGPGAAQRYRGQLRCPKGRLPGRDSQRQPQDPGNGNN